MLVADLHIIAAIVSSSNITFINTVDTYSHYEVASVLRKKYLSPNKSEYYSYTIQSYTNIIDNTITRYINYFGISKIKI